MKEEDIFKFEDFLGESKIQGLMKMKQDLLNNGIFEEAGYEEIDPSMNPYKYDDNTNSIHNKMLGNEDEENLDYIDIEEDEYDDNTNNIHNKMLGYNDNNEEDINEDFYKLYRDKSEEFVCDISVEGVKQSDTEVRLVVESDDWTLMFSGEIVNGKCIIPIKKLSILSEGQIGKIKLEVNADGNLFIPWEDRFIVKSSKKVTVSMNESKSKKSKSGVNVKVIK